MGEAAEGKDTEFSCDVLHVKKEAVYVSDELNLVDEGLENSAEIAEGKDAEFDLRAESAVLRDEFVKVRGIADNSCLLNDEKVELKDEIAEFDDPVRLKAKDAEDAALEDVDMNHIYLLKEEQAELREVMVVADLSSKVAEETQSGNGDNKED